ALQIAKQRVPASLLSRINETASLGGSPRERGTRSLSRNSVYPLSKSRGSVWVAAGRLPIGAQGLPTNLLDPKPSINPPTRPLRSTRSFVTCGNRTMLSSRRKMAGIWSMGASECRSQNWPPVRTAYEAGSKNQLSKYPPQACNSGPVLDRNAIPFFGRPCCPSVAPTGSANQPIMTLKARSSSVEHCPHTAEVGGSIPSRAYQARGNRLESSKGRAARRRHAEVG